MKHIKLFEQFVNEAAWTDRKANSTQLIKAAADGRYIGRYKESKGVIEEWENETAVTNASEYSTDTLIDAAYALGDAGVNVKEKLIKDGILSVKFGGFTYSYEYKNGKWMASGQGSPKAKDIYQFITYVVAQKYVKFKDKAVGSK